MLELNQIFRVKYLQLPVLCIAELGKSCLNLIAPVQPELRIISDVNHECDLEVVIVVMFTS